MEGELASAAPGRRYLLERKRSALIAEQTSRVARRLALDLDEQLTSLARETRRLPLPSGKGELPVVLSSAYLVARPQEADVREVSEEASARLSKLGVSVQLSGPWAAYRFLSRDDSRATGGPGGGE
jgi:hypothetical protein